MRISIHDLEPLDSSSNTSKERSHTHIAGYDMTVEPECNEQQVDSLELKKMRRLRQNFEYLTGFSNQQNDLINNGKTLTGFILLE